MEIYDNPDSNLENLISDPYLHFTGMVKAENLLILNELKELHKENLLSDSFQSRTRYNQYYLKDKGKNDPIILNAQKLVRKSRHYHNSKNDNTTPRILRRLKNANYGNVRTAISNMLFTIELLESKRTKKIAKGTENKKSLEKSLNEEVKEILDSVIEIINPGIKKASIKYAFFVETRKRIDDTDTSHIYCIKSDEEIDNPSDIRLDENGLIYNLLYGLYDLETKNIQTLLAGAKIDDGKIISFKDKYFVTKFGDEYKIEVEQDFIDLYKKDWYDNKTRKGVIFYDKLGKSVRPLDEANMFLALRFANLQEPSNASEKCGFEGRAVLLIMNSEKATTINFLNFMSNEKVRLLLLIKEELLDYLQKQFDNDAFGEIVKNKKNAIYRKTLSHGLLNYTDVLEYLIKEIQQNPVNAENYLLFNIIIQAIKGQIDGRESFLGEEENYEMNLEEGKMGYTYNSIFKIIEVLCQSKYIGKSVIDFKYINLDNFDKVKIKAHKIVIEAILPEIIINMNKYCTETGDPKISISYDKTTKILQFKNKVDNLESESNNKHEGGSLLCKNIMEKLNGKFETYKTEDGNFFIAKLTLP